MAKTPKQPNSVVIYRDDKRRAVVSGVTTPSANIKTGPMMQVAILTDTIDPLTAIKTGDDVDVCGSCALRPKTSGGSGTCYVNVGQMPNAVWKATSGSKNLTDPGSLPPKKPIRLGSYGDPSFLPVKLLSELTSGRRWTGYSHQWRSKKTSRKYARFLMASIDKVNGVVINQITEAKALGYRYFRVSDDVNDVKPNEVLCPNFTHKVQCADCGLCNGSTGPNDKRKDVVIPVHGSGSGEYQRANK